jgi:hypothetical protein
MNDQHLVRQMMRDYSLLLQNPYSSRIADITPIPTTLTKGEFFSVIRTMKEKVCSTN